MTIGRYYSLIFIRFLHKFYSMGDIPGPPTAQYFMPRKPRKTLHVSVNWLWRFLATYLGTFSVATLNLQTFDQSWIIIEESLKKNERCTKRFNLTCFWKFSNRCQKTRTFSYLKLFYEIFVTSQNIKMVGENPTKRETKALRHI